MDTTINDNSIVRPPRPDVNPSSDGAIESPIVLDIVTPSSAGETDQKVDDMSEGINSDVQGEPSAEPSDSVDLQSIIDSLNQHIEDAYTALFTSDSDSFMHDAGLAINDLLKDWYNMGRTMYGLNQTNAMSYAQSIYSTIFSLVNQQLTNDYQLRNWYMQQDYNLPSNQILRLEEAGINPAFYFGSASKSNADSISSGSQAQAAEGQYGDNTTNSQRRREKILGIVGGVANIASGLVTGGWQGITQGVKNMADTTAVLGNYHLQANLNPLQMSLIQAQTANTWAQKFLADTDNAYKPELYKAQQYQFIEQGKNYSQTVNLMQRDIDAKLQIAKWSNDAQYYSSDKSFLGTIMSANIGAAASRYAADTNAAAMKFSSRLSIVPDILKHVYTHQREEQLYDASTGQKLTLSAEERAKFNLAIAKGDLDFKEGAEFLWNNRKVRGYYFDTDVLDAVRLNNMNNYFNNFIETGHVFGKNSPDMSKMSSDASDFLNMVDYAMPYINKAAAHGITTKMMNYPMKSDKGLLEPIPLFGQWNAKNGDTFQPAKY